MDKQNRPVSVLHALWLLVFVVDASLIGRGWDHRLGAVIFFLFFGGLIFTELRSYRSADSPSGRESAPVLDRRTPSGH